MLTQEQYQSIVDNYDRIEPYGAMTTAQYVDKDVHARRWHLKKGKHEIALIRFLEMTFEQFIEKLDIQCALQYYTYCNNESFNSAKEPDWSVIITSDDNRREVLIERKELNKIITTSSYEDDRIRNALFELPPNVFEGIRSLAGCPDNTSLTESEEKMIANALFEADMACLKAHIDKEATATIKFNRVDGIGKAAITINMSDVKRLNRLNVSSIDEQGNRIYTRTGNGND